MGIYNYFFKLRNTCDVLEMAFKAEFILGGIKFEIEKCMETNKKWNISIKQFKHWNGVILIILI